MAGIWAVGELVDGAPTRLTLELATLARQLAVAAATEGRVLLVGPRAGAAAGEVAAHGVAVTIVETPPAEVPAAASVAVQAAALIARRGPDLVLLGTTQDGRDVAGTLLGLTDLPVLVSASGVSWSAGRPAVEMRAFGGSLVTRSTFAGARGIVLVRPASVAAEVADAPGAIESIPAGAELALAPVRVVERVTQSAASASIEEARVIVAGGRGVGSAEGFAVIADLADALGGVVGATRPPVDSGWVAYGQQIGQTGKIVKPDLYVACGISGAIQHRVGVQGAGAIVAINRDAEAPIAEFADLLVVGDLLEVVPRLAAAIRARRGP